jgi:hypothetical protein
LWTKAAHPIITFISQLMSVASKSTIEKKTNFYINMIVESQVVVSPVPSSVNKNKEEAKLDAASEEFLAQVGEVCGDYEYPMPSLIDSIPADLFGGDLGDYELHGE